MKPEDFAKTPGLNEPLDFKNLNLTLLNAAIFHETNRQRSAKGSLTHLQHSPHLENLAAIQTRNILKRKTVTHLNSNPGQRTLKDRFHRAGISSTIWAENLAMVFGIKYESGSEFYSGNTDGVPTPSKTPDGPPIPPHTYKSFATAVLNDWMDSPGHRKNILLTDITTLGTYVLYDTESKGVPTFYCAQVFAGEVTKK